MTQLLILRGQFRQATISNTSSVGRADGLGLGWFFFRHIIALKYFSHISTRNRRY